MILTEYDYDTDIAVQREEAYEEGAKQKAIETAKKMLCDKLSVETVSKYTGLNLETIVQLATELSNTATPNA